jgi:hypothetical protein
MTCAVPNPAGDSLAKIVSQCVQRSPGWVYLLSSFGAYRYLRDFALDLHVPTVEWPSDQDIITKARPVMAVHPMSGYELKGSGSRSLVS